MLKRRFLLVGVSLGVAVFLAGCGGRDEAPTGTSGGKAEPAPGAMERVAQTAGTVVTQAQHVVQAVEKTAEQAQAAVVQATEQVQGYLDQAKALLAEKKVQEATGVLDRLAGMTLSSEQQQLLTGLKTEAAQLLKDIEAGLKDLKTTVTEKRYTDASALVTKLAAYQMSPEQQRLYDDLKTQVKQLMETQAAKEGTKALNNLLGR